MSHTHDHEGCCQRESTCGCSHDHHHGESKAVLIAILVSGGLFAGGHILCRLLSLPLPWEALWMGAAAVALGPLILPAAWRELKGFQLGENMLLVIAGAAAFAIGEWTEGALVLLLFTLGQWLEEWAMDRSRTSIAALAAVTPDTARLVGTGGAVTVMAADRVAVGDILQILPHDRVPVDGQVLTGESAVDAAALTGESAPRYVSVGDVLLSGSVNGNGTLTMRATAVAEESAAVRILRLVEESAARKGQAERFITRFARVYTPVVVLLGLLVAVVPPLFGGGWTTWIHRALVFLVSSCPCALVLSVPLCFTVGMAVAARQGVLLKGGRYIEMLARARAVAFDKTGTLTTDSLAVEEVLTVPGVTREQALSLAAALEQGSSHPAGRALCAAAAAAAGEIADLQEKPGLGITARWQGNAVACGGRRLMERLGVSVDDFPPASAYLVQEGRAVAAFTMSACLQEGAREVVASLRKLGVQRLVMLTGDRQAPAQTVAQAVGLSDEVYGDLTAAEKLSHVQALQGAGYATAFVGDGINDAPVLAAADVGLSMGLGSPAALETADGVLVEGGLSRLPGAIRLCRRVVGTVGANVVFALAVKLAVLVLAVTVGAPMWLAMFADVGVMLLSVANALRLLLIKTR